MIEPEMSIVLSLSARKKIYAGIVIIVLLFAGLVFYMGKSNIALCILGVDLLFAVIGFLSLRSQAKYEKEEGVK